MAQSLTLPNNSDVVILGVTVENGPVPVWLASGYNRGGIYTDKTTFTNIGGMDGSGHAYSANLLGSNQFWNNMFFNFGPINATNVVSCAGQTLALPAGQFTSLELLATGVNGSQSSQHFTVTYTNTTATFTENFSDWVSPTTYSGQTTLATMPYHDSSGGGYVNSEANLFGYTFNLNSANVVQSITLPSNANVVILAMTLSNATTAL